MSKTRAPRSIAPDLGRRPPGRRTQRGVALLILLAILMVGVLYGVFSSLNEATATAPLQRSQHNAEVLRQAKEALIAYALQRPNPFGPGHLPCPDRNNDGNSDGATCGTAATRIGRLPWRSLDLHDVRGSSGERLWYAVSRCFLERLPDVFCDYAVNSDTQGQLSVTGLSPAANVVAVIFAPGAPVAAQVRDGPGPDPKTAVCSPAVDNNCRVVNYLEDENAGLTNDVFVSATSCEGGDPAKCALGAINDQFIVITHEDLFRAVEEEVRTRLDRELALQLSDYWTKWRTALGLAAGAVVMPFAAPFIDGAADPTRSLDLYRGAVGQTVGLLPLTRDTANFVTWDIGTVAVDTRAPPGSGLWTPVAPTGLPSSPAPDLDVTVTHDGTDREYRLYARLRNVGLTFALPLPTPTPSGFFGPVGLTQSFDASGNLDVTYTATVTGAPGGPLTLSVPRTSFSPLTLVSVTPAAGGVTRAGSTVTVSVPSTRHGFAVNDQVHLGGANETAYNGVWTITAVPTPNTFQFDIGAATPASPATGSIKVYPRLAWLVQNNWYRHVLYAVSPGVVPGTAPGFTGTCVPPPGSPACVVVQSTRPADVRTDARFALVLAGRHIKAAPRTWILPDLFEGNNATASGAPVLERRLRGPQFNDKVVAK